MAFKFWICCLCNGRKSVICKKRSFDTTSSKFVQKKNVTRNFIIYSVKTLIQFFHFGKIVSKSHGVRNVFFGLFLVRFSNFLLFDSFTCSFFWEDIMREIFRLKSIDLTSFFFKFFKVFVSLCLFTFWS